jgi:hypothetical protein
LLPYFCTLDFPVVMSPSRYEEGSWWADVNGPRGRNTFKTKVEDYVEWLQEKEPSRSLPKVVLVPFQPITRALYENL